LRGSGVPKHPPLVTQAVRQILFEGVKMNTEIHNLAVQIYDTLNKNGAGLGNASIGIIESAIEKSAQQPRALDGACTCGLSNDSFHPNTWHEEGCPMRQPRQ
jgi:hypothetical protein